MLQDPSVMDIACAALNGLKMGDRTLTVRRASARWNDPHYKFHFTFFLFLVQVIFILSTIELAFWQDQTLSRFAIFISSACP